MRPTAFFSFLFPLSRQPARRHRPMRRANSSRISRFEPLQARTLLAITIFDEMTGALEVTGDDCGDEILVSAASLAASSVSASSVRSIRVIAGSANDTIDLSYVDL